MKRIVVTGCEGQLGAELCRQLGREAIGLDLPEFDLTDRERVRARLAEIGPQVVINTAAFTAVDRAEQETAPCRAVNVDGVANLLDACAALVCMVVHISTDYVFGRDLARTTPYRETDAPGPQGVYAETKLAGEQLVVRRPEHLIVRTCGLYGAAGPRSAGNFVDTILRLAGSGRALRVVHDQHCTPSYVPHVARAIRFLVDTGACGIYHVVNSGQTTWHGMAAEILRQSGLSTPLEAITALEYGAPAPRPAYSVLDTGKYHALPGRPTMPPWHDALAEYLAARGRG